MEVIGTIKNDSVIAKYCDLHLATSTLFKNYIHDNPCFIMNLMDRKYLDAEELNFIKVMIVLQKERNLLIKKEILNLLKTNQEFIGLKGYFLQMFYYPEENVRLFGDLDILAKTDNGYILYKELKKLGYIIDKHSGLYRRLIHSSFFVSILKSFYTSNNKHIRMKSTSSVILELHTNINDNCPKTTNAMFNVERMFSESILRNFEREEVKILSPVDNILYLMFHTIEHIAFIDLYGTQISINLQSFYDVAQIICCEKIDWTLFFDRSIEYNILPFVSIFVKIFSDIFQDLIPSNIITKVYCSVRKMEFSWKKIYMDMENMEPSEIILGDYRKIPYIHKAYKKACVVKQPEKIWQNLYENGCK